MIYEEGQKALFSFILGQDILGLAFRGQNPYHKKKTTIG